MRASARWRVRYAVTRERMVESANEIRLPVGRTVTFELASADVIHASGFRASPGRWT